MKGWGKSYIIELRLFNMEHFKPVLVVVDYQEDFCPPVRETRYPTQHHNTDTFSARHSSSRGRSRHCAGDQRAARLAVRTEDRHPGLAPARPHFVCLEPLTS